MSLWDADPWARRAEQGSFCPSQEEQLQPRTESPWPAQDELPGARAPWPGLLFAFARVGTDGQPK